MGAKLVIVSLWLCSIAPSITFNIWGNSEEVIVDPENYGVDYTYPIHHNLESKRTPFFYKRYTETMAGCYKKYSKSECDVTERVRIDMNLDQPSTQHNYTEVGFKKMKVPEDIWSSLQKFYEENRDKEKLEAWPRGNTYVNHWVSPSYMISFEDRSLRGGTVLKQAIWDSIKRVIEEWTGKKVMATSLYGIRVYHNKAILATHVDRLPLVSSCIIQVAQNLNEPWPIEVYSHDGKAHNVTMQPGEMVLYESHSVLHGRPFPLNGSLYANVFVHYAPIDHDNMNILDEQRKKGSNSNENLVDVVESGGLGRWWSTVNNNNPMNHKTFTALKQSDEANSQNIGGHEQNNHDQDLIDELVREERDSEDSHDSKGDEQTQATPNPQDKGEILRFAAAAGDLNGVEKVLADSHNSDVINSSDENGWMAIHEAARSGDLEVVKFLVEMGADIGAKVIEGGTPLWVARHSLDYDDPVIAYLIEIGAPDDETEENQ